MTRFASGCKSLLIICLLAVISLPSTGCRSAGGWSSMPPMAWFHKKKDAGYETEGWASFDGAPDVTPPSTNSQPTGVESPEFATGGAALAKTDSRGGGQPVSYESADPYPKTNSPNPYSGLERGATASNPRDYEEVARRGSRELWNMDSPSNPTPTPPAAPSRAGTQRPYYTQQAPPATEPQTNQEPARASAGEVPPWSSSGGAPGASSSLPPWQSSTGPPAELQPQAPPSPGSGAMEIPPSWLKAGGATNASQNASAGGPAAGGHAPSGSASVPTAPWSPPTMSAGANGQTPPWNTADGVSTPEASSPSGSTSRSEVPWRPGSTSDYVPQPQSGASTDSPRQSYRPTTGHPQAVGLHHIPEPLTLAVDDAFPRFQFR